MLDTFSDRLRWRGMKLLAWLFPLRGIEHDTVFRRVLYLCIRKQNGNLKWWRRPRIAIKERI